jgi:hypothetical protein
VAVAIERQAYLHLDRARCTLYICRVQIARCLAVHCSKMRRNFTFLVVRTPYPYIKTQTRRGTRLSRVKKRFRILMADYLMLLESLLHFNCHGIVVAWGAPVSFTWTAIAILKFLVRMVVRMKLKSQRHCIAHRPHCNTWELQNNTGTHEQGGRCGQCLPWHLLAIANFLHPLLVECKPPQLTVLSSYLAHSRSLTFAPSLFLRTKDL